MEILILILLGGFAFLVIKRYVQLRSNSYHYNLKKSKIEMAKNIKDDKIVYPSWMSDEEGVDNDKEASIFIDTVLNKMMKSGVDPDFLIVLMKGSSSARRELCTLIISIAAQMEKRGASFVEQQTAASEVGVMYLNKIISVYEDGSKS